VECTVGAFRKGFGSFVAVDIGVRFDDEGQVERRDAEMHWLYLGVAVVFEVVVAVAAGKAEGFKRPGWTAATLVGGGVATYFLSLALLTFDVGVGYAIWTSVAGIAITGLGVLVFGQRLGWRKGVGIAVIIAGVVGLQLSGAAA
jgi:quaternary ammonium compound-resistance protein SugE